MRHLNLGRQLSRSGSHRRALLRNLLRALIEHGSIKTTVAKAKELRRFADQMVTVGKEGTLHARRRLFAEIRSDSLVSKMLADYAVRFSARNGGYTRMFHLGPRPGDNANMAVIEFMPDPNAPAKVEAKGSDKKAEKGGKKAAAPKAPAKVAKSETKAPAKKASKAEATATPKKAAKSKAEKPAAKAKAKKSK